MSRTTIGILLPALLAGSALLGRAQESAPATPTFESAAAGLERELQDSIAELARLRDEIAADQVPLGRQLSELEAELSAARVEYQDASRLLDTRTLDLGTLRTRIQQLEQESLYLSNLFNDYMNEFDTALHVAEEDRYEEALQTARLASENTSLSEEDVVRAQLALVPLSIERLDEVLGGARFDGAALDADGELARGTFVLIGPAALFLSTDGALVGTVEQRVNSLEPTVYAFGLPEDAAAAAEVVTRGEGAFPLDPTLGNARKIEATSETLWEHVQKGGPVMIPIGALAGAALLVALYKWLALTFVRKPSRKKLAALLDAVAQRDEEAARARAAAMGGPAGRMLQAGVEHMNEPRELIEEIMYERVLTTRLKLQRMLPFVAICAAAAPLLGLLGTVTGIINTFKMITVFGSGDVKSLSGGISEALITTKFGLIVAIPSLLLHAFLSRKARGIVGRMESAAIAFVNRVSTARQEGGGPAVRERDPERPGFDAELLRAHVYEAVEELVESRLAARQSEERDEIRPAAPPHEAEPDRAAAKSGDPHKPSVLVPRGSRRE